MSRTKVWVSWRDRNKRWEVGFKWKGKVRQYYSWTFQGTRWSFTKENAHIAHEYAAHIRSLMRPNDQGIVTFDPGQLTGSRKSAYSFDRYVNTVFKEYDRQVKAGDRKKEYVDHLKRYHRLYWLPAFKGLDIREINPAVLKEFYFSLADKGLSKKYRQNVMDPLKMIMRQVCEECRIQPPKFPDYKEKRNERPVPKWVSENNQDIVLDYVPDIHKPIVRMIAYHGLRLYEARTLLWSDLDLEYGAAEIRTAKGGEPRRLKLDATVISDIKKIPRTLKHQYVYHWDSKPYTKTTLWKIIRKALDKAGLNHVTPYQFGRHSCATHLIQRGAPTAVVKDMLGHSDIRTTERYTHADISDQEAYQRRSTLIQPEKKGSNDAK